VDGARVYEMSRRMCGDAAQNNTSQKKLSRQQIRDRQLARLRENAAAVTFAPLASFDVKIDIGSRARVGVCCCRDISVTVRLWVPPTIALRGCGVLELRIAGVSLRSLPFAADSGCAHTHSH
jgi:hypothetical protein